MWVCRPRTCAPIVMGIRHRAPRYHLRAVMIDADLAVLYGVEIRRLNEQLRRNEARFPSDFMFKLTNQEFRNLMSQFATSSSGAAWGGRRIPPYAFTARRHHGCHGAQQPARRRS